MKITLTPMRHETPLAVTRKGAILELNGTSCDLSKGESCDWISGIPARSEGVWHVTLILPHGADAPEETLFPATIEMEGDGPVPLPPYCRPEEETPSPEPEPGALPPQD